MAPPDDKHEAADEASISHNTRPDQIDPPDLLAGGRAVSLAGVLERIEAEFDAEVGERLELLFEASEADRWDMIREVTDYVLVVEGITLSRGDRLALLDALYDDIFHFGPIGRYLADPVVSEIVISGPERVHVRHGTGDLRAVEERFSSAAHLERVVGRVMATGGARMSEHEPFVEVGVRLAGRPARLTATGPPFSTTMHATMRLHPPQPPTLEGLAESALLDEAAASLLRGIVAAGHGLMIAGDVGTGKTTLLQALLPCLPAGSLVVERAAELRVPSGLRQIAAVPPWPGRTPVTFEAQTWAALDDPPEWLVLDEVRFDDSAALWAALATAPPPRCMWAFRAATDPLRLRTAFEMAVRRTHQTLEQAAIHHALLERLPFVALMARRAEGLRLIGISEWQPEGANRDAITLRALWPTVEASPLHPLPPLSA